MSWLLPRRISEATDQQLIASGAWGGGGVDPIDGDVGFTRQAGAVGRPIPHWNLERMRAFSIAGYRSNPMARAIVDTYVAFCVGDTGVKLASRNAEVLGVAERFWTDPKVNLAERQEVGLRSHLLNGESLYEMMVGAMSGVVRYSPIDPGRITSIDLDGGNPMWPTQVTISMPATFDPLDLRVVQVDELSGLRTGEAMFWPSFKTLETDVRGEPFLSPVLDWLDSYDNVLSNLIDRTALARYLAYDVTLHNGDPDDFIAKRGGNHLPKSGTIEVHNEAVEFKPINAQSGAFEDRATIGTIMTTMAAGSGLSKVWLAEPEDANRATALTMAEPVRRRIGSVQNVWLRRQTELVRFVVDQAVIRGRLPATVPVEGSGEMIPAAEAVEVTGPQIATADAKVTAEVMHRLSLGIKELAAASVISKEAAAELVEKSWSDFMGVPFRPELAAALDGGDLDTVADALDGAANPLTAMMAA